MIAVTMFDFDISLSVLHRYVLLWLHVLGVFTNFLIINMPAGAFHTIITGMKLSAKQVIPSPPALDNNHCLSMEELTLLFKGVRNSF